jgi:serine/threonine-protein kinase
MTPSRYELLVKIASGGMGTVYVGRALGAGGFWRLVAIKRAHPHLREDASLHKELVREGRLASRVNHVNVVSVLDVEQADGELLLVMEYVDGTSLSQLVKAAHAAGERLEPSVVLRIVSDVSAGLQAAHDACDEQGHPLGIVHRDVSPHNVIVGVDGIAKLADFGVAKALRESATASLDLRGKLGYMAPEYLAGAMPTPRTDVYALGVTAWEAFASTPLSALASSERSPLASFDEELARFDEVITRATHRDPAQRFASAAEFGSALATLATPADPKDVAATLERHVGGAIAARRAAVQEVVSRNDQQTMSFGPAPSAAIDVPVTPSRRRRTLPMVVVALAAVPVLVVAAFAVDRAGRPVGEPPATGAALPPAASASVAVDRGEDASLDATPLAEAEAVTSATTSRSTKVAPSRRPPASGRIPAPSPRASPRPAESVAPNPYRR